MADTAPLIILGTGLAGYNLARELRKLDTQREMILISRDDGCSYSKPMLSTGFAKDKTAEALVMKVAASMADQLGAQILTHTHVTAIDPTQRRVEHAGGWLAYSDLVLACGASPRQLPGVDRLQDKILSINDLQDYARFREALGAQQRVVIIGAGLIGCEFANDLLAAGLDIHVVAPDTQIMSGLIPAPVATAVQQALEAQGVTFHLGRSVVGMQAYSKGLQLTLDNGDQLQADQGLSAIGLQPNTELATAAGLACKRGIGVDRYLRTSDPHVYALGDCAEVHGLNLMYVMPLMAAARALAKTLAGEPSRLSYGPMPVIIKTPACPLVVSPPLTATSGAWQVESLEGGLRALFRDSEGQLHGYALTGHTISEKLQLNRQLPDWLE